MSVHTEVGEGAHHSSTGLDNRKLAMWAFLGSECMFFGSLIMVALINRSNTMGMDPEHYGQGALNLVLTSFTTFVLLTSSLAMVLALAAFRNGRLGWGRLWLGVVIVLGAIFLGGQVVEFNDFVLEGLTPSTNNYWASFYTLVGFHGTHVGIGIAWLLATFIYSFRGRFRTSSTTWGIEMAGLYWHFVDLVWVGIFTLIYLI